LARKYLQEIYPEKETVSIAVNLSRAAIMRRAEDISSDLFSKFRKKVKEFLSSCLTLNESNDSDTAQLLSVFEVYTPFD
jgi:hypothetical protein